MESDLLKAVTLFYDVKRDSFPFYSRSKLRYISNFLEFFSRVKVDLLIVTAPDEQLLIEKHLKKYKETNSFQSSISFVTHELEDFTIHEHLSKFKIVLKSPEMFFFSMRDRLAGNPDLSRFIQIFRVFSNFISYRGNDIFGKFSLKDNFSPEYNSAEYLLTVLSKIEAIKIAKNIGFFQNQNRFAFIDFGEGSGDRKLLNHFSGRSLNDTSDQENKFVFINRIETPKYTSPWEYAKMIDDALTPSNFFMIPASKFDEFYSWWNAEIKMLLNQNIVVDDQILLSIFQASFPEEVEILKLSIVQVSELHEWIPLDRFLT